MVMGQGAAMALPIYGLYMQKVYADKTLDYSEDAVFDLPSGYNPCSLLDDGGGENGEGEVDETVEANEIFQ
jgi:penicillin-binding protein 1A